MLCQKCEKETNALFPMLYSDGEKLMICQECQSSEDARADYEYERWREETHA